MKIIAVGAELFHANPETVGQTDRHKQTHDAASSSFLQFCERA